MLTLGPLPIGTVSQVLRLDETDQLRLTSYAKSWATYWGRGWQGVRMSGDPVVNVNYARLLVDKAVSYFVKGGFVITVPEPLEEVVTPFLDEVWRVNRRDLFLYHAATMGAVTGDVFVLVTPEPPDPKDDGRYALTGGRIKIHLLASHQVFPTWDPLDRERMRSVRIETLYPNQADPTRMVGRFTQIITDTEITEWWHGQPPTTRPNILGRIPIVHIQNRPVPCEFWGASDIEPIRDLQDELNEMVTDMSDAVRFNGSPVVFIIGAKAANLQRGPNQVWSGFPVGTTIGELGGTSNLQMIGNHIDFIKKAMSDLAHVPPAAMESPAISNTSASALQMTYGPMEEVAGEKRITFGEGFQEVNHLILRIGELLGAILLPRDLCSQCGGRILRVYDAKLKRSVLRCYEVDRENLQWVTPETLEEVREAERKRLGQELKDDPTPAPPPEGDPKAQPLPVKTPEEKLEEELEKFQTVAVPAAPIRNPLTGEAVQYQATLRLLPTGCRCPIPLDPFQTTVEFVGGLPRDEQLQYTLFGSMLRDRVVSRAWVRRKMACIAPNERDNIAREVREEAKEDPASKTQGPGYAAPGVPEMKNDATKPGGHNEKKDADTT